MTTLLQKDLLLIKAQEWGTANKIIGKVHSEMYGIITALPDGESSSLPLKNRRHDRPVVVKPTQSDTVDVAVLSTAAEKPKKKRAERTKEDDLRKAAKLFVDGMFSDDPLTQGQAERAAGIPAGALFKGKGKEILAELMNAASRVSRRIDTPNGTRRKEIENANVYDNLR
jgi:hypothetical protein